MPYSNMPDEEIHTITENKSGIEGLCVLFSVENQHYRVRLRPVPPIDHQTTVDKGDAWTMYEWVKIPEPTPEADAVEYFDLTHVPPVVRNEFDDAVIQVPERG